MTRIRSAAAITLLAFLVASCGGPPRIQTTLAGEPRYTGLEHWVPIPGRDKVDKRDSTLVFADTGIRVEDKKTQPIGWDYEDISDASYSYSKQPSWALGIGLALFICLPCLAFAFIKKKQHWVALDTPDGPQLFKAHKNNYTAIITGLERNGIEVERLVEGEQ